MINRFHISANERGAAVVELALVAPMIALMVIGVVDMSNAVARKLQLEQAAQRAIEKVMNTTGDTTVEQTISDEVICQINGANADGTCKTGRMTASNVSVTYRLECNGTLSTATDCNTGETAAEWIQVSLTDTYTPMFPIRFKGLNGDGKYHLAAVAGMRIQ